MGVNLCQACCEVRFDGGVYWCNLQQRTFPDATQCAQFKPEPGPATVHAESGADLPWDGIAFTDVAQ